jgi:PHP family Zn ribbon phosphoesterase
LETKDLELFNLQQNNQQLLKKYGAEIAYLLNAQKESQVSPIQRRVLDVLTNLFRLN